jgi:hypothetical protein
VSVDRDVAEDIGRLFMWVRTLLLLLLTTDVILTARAAFSGDWVTVALYLFCMGVVLWGIRDLWRREEKYRRLVRDAP